MEAAWGAVVNLCQAGVTYMHPSFQKQNHCHPSCCRKHRPPLLGNFIPCTSQAPNMVWPGCRSLSSHWKKWVRIKEPEPPHQATPACTVREQDAYSGPVYSQPRGPHPQKWKEQSEVTHYSHQVECFKGILGIKMLYARWGTRMEEITLLKNHVLCARCYAPYCICPHT